MSHHSFDPRNTLHSQISNSTEHSWLPLESLTLDTSLVAEPLTKEMLPEPLQELTFSKAKSLNNCEPDFIAISIIVSLAAILGTNVSILPKRRDRWSVSPVMWGIIVGEPSSMKSPSMGLAINGLRHVEQHVFAPDLSESQELYELQLKRYDKQKNALQQEAQAENITEQQLKGIAKQLSQLEKPVKPKTRHVYVSDATVEAVMKVVIDSPSGILFYRDELSGWFQQMEQPGWSAGRAFYLEGFNGSRQPYKLLRAVNGKTQLDQFAINIFGGIQPKMLGKILKQKTDGYQDDGLVERFLLMSVYPEKSDLSVTDVQVEPQLELNLIDIYQKFARVDDYQNPLEFHFSDDAQVLWDDWNKKAVDMMNHQDTQLGGYYGKRPAHCAKLALVFELIEQAANCGDDEFKPDLTVSMSNLERAILWMGYLASHAVKILNIATAVNKNEPAHSLLKNIQKLGKSFTKHQLSQKGWAMLKTPEQREQALEQLVSSGYLKKVEEPTKQYIVHPHLSL